MYSPKGSKPFHARPLDLRHPLADESPRFAWSADCRLAVPSAAVVPLYSHRNVTSAPGYPSGNIAVNITTANRGKGWPKQKPQAALTQAASTDYSSTFSTHFGICIIRTSPKYKQSPCESVHNPSLAKTRSGCSQ